MQTITNNILTETFFKNYYWQIYIKEFASGILSP